MKLNNSQHITRTGIVKRNPPKTNSSSKEQTFSGTWEFEDGGKPANLSFNLYGQDDIDFEQTKETILDNMNRKHFEPMRKLFASCGLRLIRFEYYSPREYNSRGDNVDLVVSVTNRELLKRFIKSNASGIQKMLDSNKSYDGYMSLTSSNVQEIIEKIDEDFNVDIIVIAYIQTKHVLNAYDDLFDLYIPEDEE